MTDAPTEREIERLHQDMQLIRALSTVERRDLGFHCVYCGQRCYGRTCKQHRDLVQIENRLAAA